jgi:hypothetical protein
LGESGGERLRLAGRDRDSMDVDVDVDMNVIVDIDMDVDVIVDMDVDVIVDMDVDMNGIEIRMGIMIRIGIVIRIGIGIRSRIRRFVYGWSGLGLMESGGGCLVEEVWAGCVWVGWGVFGLVRLAVEELGWRSSLNTRG